MIQPAMKCLVYCTSILLLSVTAYGQGFDEEFDGSITDGPPPVWTIFGEENGTLSVEAGSATLTPLTGDCCFGAATDFAHSDIIIESQIRFPAGSETTFLFHVFRIDENTPGEYWTAISPLGELAIGGFNDDGSDFIAARDIFMDSGPLGTDDLVNLRTAVTGSTIQHSAWLEGSDPSTGASVSWTDDLQRNLTGDAVAFSMNADGSLTDGAVMNYFRVMVVPEPTGAMLFVTAAAGLVGMRRRNRVCSAPSDGTGQSST